MMLTLLLLRRINMRSKVLAKVNHYLGIKTNFRAKGIKIISFHITLNVVMLIVYSGFNTFINFPVFSVFWILSIRSHFSSILLVWNTPLEEASNIFLSRRESL